MRYNRAVIDWSTVIASASWLVGLALLLAALSQRIWQLEKQALPQRAAFRELPENATTWLALALVAAGLAGTSDALWEMGLWLLFVAVGLYYAVKMWRAPHRT